MPEHAGVMVAFFVPPVEAQQIALENGQAPEELHLTLAYLGEGKEVGALDKLPALVQEWAAEHPPVTGLINGVGRFNKTQDDGTCPVYASFDSPELPAWRQSLVEHLVAHGYTPRMDHGFIPHITLAYSDKDAPIAANLPRSPLTFDEISVSIVGERQDFPLAVQEVIRQLGDKWFLFSKAGDKKLGGPYDDRQDAEDRERQVQFFKHRGEGAMTGEQRLALDLVELKAYSPPARVWATRDELDGMYPGTASLLLAQDIGRVNLARIGDESLAAVREAIGKDPGFFDKCMASSLGGFKPKDKSAFCAWFHHQIVGKWPAESINVAGAVLDAARFRESLVTALWPVREGRKPFTGREWDVTIIGADKPSDIVRRGGKEYVLSQNGRLYACTALRDSAPEWDGVKVYDNHLTDTEFQDRQGMRSVAQEWIGSIVKPRWAAAQRQLRGVFKVVDEALAKKLLEAHQQGILTTIGLSIDTLPKTKAVWHEGQPLSVIEGFKRIFSVDLVAEPAAGGKFNRLLASVQGDSDQEALYGLMETKEVREFILAATREAVLEAARATGANGRLRANSQSLQPQAGVGAAREAVVGLHATLAAMGTALEALDQALS